MFLGQEAVYYPYYLGCLSLVKSNIPKNNEVGYLLSSVFIVLFLLLLEHNKCLKIRLYKLFCCNK